MNVSPKGLGIAAFASLLVLSLGPKVVLALSPATVHRPVTAAAMAAEIERSGYRVLRTSEPPDLPSVEARAGGCDVVVTRAAPQGWNRSIIRETAGARHLVYAYDGTRFDRQPVLRTSLLFHWELLKRRAGLPSHMPAVFALAWAPDCAAGPPLDLSDLRE